MEEYNDDLLSNLGGELQVRYENDIRYIDYLKEIGSTSETDIRLGKNIQALTRDKESIKFLYKNKGFRNKIKES